ncbi:hypothetical protein E6O75_ATG06141 [Venturia nashicola]|uniref:Uncharacterized protein n=1 Tax=Venturia nashicola TaxID=86259 RepID=A0A4Z1P4L5_9PEZI|nr:hypothetical protein E6O75_ATG06141 [Venturia nashicola]
MGPIRKTSAYASRTRSTGPPRKPSEDPPERKPNRNHRAGAGRNRARKRVKKDKPNNTVFTPEESEDSENMQVTAAVEQEPWPDLEPAAAFGLETRDFAPSALGARLGTAMASRRRAYSAPSASTTPIIRRGRGLSTVARIDFGAMTAEALVYTVQRAADEMDRRMRITSIEGEAPERKRKFENGGDGGTQ